MAVLFSAGNIPIYWEALDLHTPSFENTAGFVSSICAFATVAGSRILEIAKNIPKERSSIPHFSLAGFNFAAAGGSAFALINEHIDPSLLSVGMTAAFTGWGLANLTRGIEKRDDKLLRGVLRPDILWPSSDIAATLNTAGWPFGFIALLKSQFIDPENVRNIDVKTPQEFLIKHASWDRILLTSYGVAASMSHPYIAAGFVLFCLGYLENGDQDINKTFLKDLKVLGNSPN